MKDVWPPPPANQPDSPLPHIAERAGVVALLFTLGGMLLVGVADLSQMHIIEAANLNPNLGTPFNSLGLLGVLMLVVGGVLGARGRNTKHGPPALIMSFFTLLAVGIVVLGLTVQGQL